MLKVVDLEVAYDHYQVLWGVSLSINQGKIACLLGPNGAGKSTLMNAISGLVRVKAGRIIFRDKRIDTLKTREIADQGLAHVLERRRVFPYLTVEENLHLGGYVKRAREDRPRTIEWTMELFPILRDRRKQLAHTLSGGEQQMLAIARGLMAKPLLLMVDEPFLGLSPSFVDQTLEVFGRLRDKGITIFFIEQNVQQALEISDWGYIMESGRMVLSGPAQDLLKDDRIKDVYLGVI
jgi:branched-chain amino acid transport system ATP-binding protein